MKPVYFFLAANSEEGFFSLYDQLLCIKCHSCVRNCPMGAKYFDDPAFLSHRAMLERDYTRRAEDKIFTA